MFIIEENSITPHPVDDRLDYISFTEVYQSKLSGKSNGLSIGSLRKGVRFLKRNLYSIPKSNERCLPPRVFLL
jgi:hypothetical protein